MFFENLDIDNINNFKLKVIITRFFFETENGIKG